MFSVSLEYKKSNSEEALVLPASKVASTCINAAIVVEFSKLVYHFLCESYSINDWEDISFFIHLLLSVQLQSIYIIMIFIYC